MKFFFLLLGVLFVSHSWAKPLTLEELEKKVRELEEKQDQLLQERSEPTPNVRSFLNDNLAFGGFFEPAFTFISGPDTDTQAGPSSNALGINLSASFNSNLKFVSQYITVLSLPIQNAHNDPRGASAGLPPERQFKNPLYGAILTQGYIEYAIKRSLNFQMGLGYVPFGYYFQQRELVLFVRRGGPQLLRTSELVSPLWTGFHMYGSWAMHDMELGYNLYTFTPSGLKTPGVGARAWLASADRKVVAGLSTQYGKSADETVEVVGADVRVDVFPYVVKAEFAQQISKGSDPWSAYVEPNVYVYNEEILLYVFGDYANSPLNKTGSGSLAIRDPYAKWEYGGGINWLPTSYTRFRVGLTYYDYVGRTAIINGRNRDYVGVDVSAGIAF